MNVRSSLALALPLNVILGLAMAGPIQAAEPLIPESVVSVFAALSGSSVLPDAGDPTAGGWVQLDIDVASGSLCAWWNTSGLDDATAAHVHAGAADVVGDVVRELPLPTTVTPTEPPDGETGGEAGADPCQTGLDPALLGAIVDDPAAFYVDVHTPAYPDGAARGQLSLDLPAPPPCTAPTVCDGLVGAGDYEYFGFSRSLSFTLADEWQASNGSLGFTLADAHGQLSFLSFSGIGATDACGTTTSEIGFDLAAIVEWLSTHPALDGATTGSATIGGMSATQLEGTVAIPDACDTTDLLMIPAAGVAGVEPGSGDGELTTLAVLTGDGFSVADGEQLRMALIPLDGQVVLAALTAPAGDAFAALADHAQGVLDGVTWGPAPTPCDEGCAAEGSGAGDAMSDAAMRRASATVPFGAMVLGGLLLGIGLGQLRRRSISR